MKINYAVPFFNTVICLPARTDSHQPISCLAILSRTHSPHTTVPLHQSGRRAPKRQNNKSLRHWNNQKHSTTYMPTHYLTYALALRWLYKANRENYGMYTGQLSPSNQITGTMSKLSGCVLVRNRRFLRHRIPASLRPLVPVCHPTTPNQHTSPQANYSLPPASPESTIHSRHSLRPCKPPSRFVEDPNRP